MWYEDVYDDHYRPTTMRGMRGMHRTMERHWNSPLRWKAKIAEDTERRTMVMRLD